MRKGAEWTLFYMVYLAIAMHAVFLTVVACVSMVHIGNNVEDLKIRTLAFLCAGGAGLSGAVVAALDEDQSSIEVDVFPSEASEFAGAHAGVDGGGVEGEEAAAAREGRAQEAGDFVVCAEVIVGALGDLGFADAGRTIDPSELLRVMKKRGEQREVVMQRLRCDAALVAKDVNVVGGDLIDEERTERGAQVALQDAEVVLEGSFSTPAAFEPVVRELVKRAPGRGHGPEAALNLEALELVASQGELGVLVGLKDLASAAGFSHSRGVRVADAPLTAMLGGLGHRVLHCAPA